MFDIHTYKNDIALLKLKESVNLGPTVQLICLPNYQNNTFEFPFINTLAYIMGWGLKNESNYKRDTNFLLNVRLNILETNLCNYTSEIIKNSTNKKNSTEQIKNINNIYGKYSTNGSEYQHFLSSLNMMYFIDEMFKNNNIDNSQVCAGLYDEGGVDSCQG